MKKVTLLLPDKIYRTVGTSLRKIFSWSSVMIQVTTPAANLSHRTCVFSEIHVVHCHEQYYFMSKFLYFTDK